MVSYVVRRVDLSRIGAPGTDSEVMTKSDALKEIAKARKARATEGMHIVHGIVGVVT